MLDYGADPMDSIMGFHQLVTETLMSVNPVYWMWESMRIGD